MDVTAAATLFAWLDREIWLLTTASGDQRGGLIATFVSETSIVADLPRVMVSLGKQHRTWELVEASRVFALHLLSEANLGLVWQFGLRSGRDGDKFAGLTVTAGKTGCPLLGETVGWMECRVEDRLDVGDRCLYVAEVLQGKVTHFGQPLKVNRLMELAPPHLLAEMKHQRTHEGHDAAEAIRCWREQHGRGGKGEESSRT
jgi:flavin reductase (DIM6/NTAB) family NADH-FMN oxidoreductase RutF